MFITTPDGQVVDAHICLDGRVEVRCAECGGILYHDALFPEDVTKHVRGHQAECLRRNTHPEPAND